MQFNYTGACGAEITEVYEEGIRFFKCTRGRAVQSNTECYPTELCIGCNIQKLESYNNLWGELE